MFAVCQTPANKPRQTKRKASALAMLLTILGPPVVPFYLFLGEGCPTKIDYRKKFTLILTSLLEDLEYRATLAPTESCGLTSMLGAGFVSLYNISCLCLPKDPANFRAPRI